MENSYLFPDMFVVLCRDGGCVGEMETQAILDRVLSILGNSWAQTQWSLNVSLLLPLT